MSRHLSIDDGALRVLRSQEWVPVLRCRDVEDAVATALALRDGGCSVVEVTYSTPDVAVAVRRLTECGLTVGVGTVRTVEQVRESAAAGAAFVVSFHRPTSFVVTARDLGVTPIPGAFTPHEVAAAFGEGAPAVKVFPARLVPPAYLGDLRAVLGDVPLLVTGGIPAQREAIDTWRAAGAWCVGIGSPLGSVAADGAESLTARARALNRVSPSC